MIDDKERADRDLERKKLVAQQAERPEQVQKGVNSISDFPEVETAFQLLEFLRPLTSRLGTAVVVDPELVGKWIREATIDADFAMTAAYQKRFEHCNESCAGFARAIARRAWHSASRRTPSGSAGRWGCRHFFFHRRRNAYRVVIFAYL